MKKIISLLLALALGCMLIPAVAEDASVTGEWYASYAGLSIPMTVNEDGSFQLAFPGQDPTDGTWTLEGDQITITVNDAPLTGTFNGESIALAEGEMALTFTREPAASITVAEAMAAESAEAFYGDWTGTYMGSDGVIMDPAAAGTILPGLTIGEGVFTFAASGEDDIMAPLLNLMAFSATFEDGALKLAPGLEGAEASGTVQLLEDGMLMLTLDGEQAMTLYFTPAAAAAEEPAA